MYEHSSAHTPPSSSASQAARACLAEAESLDGSHGHSKRHRAWTGGRTGSGEGYWRAGGMEKQENIHEAFGVPRLLGTAARRSISNETKNEKTVVTKIEL